MCVDFTFFLISGTGWESRMSTFRGNCSGMYIPEMDSMDSGSYCDPDAMDSRSEVGCVVI